MECYWVEWDEIEEEEWGFDVDSVFGDDFFDDFDDFDFFFDDDEVCWN